MVKKPQDSSRRVSFTVSTKERPDFKEPLAAFVFDDRDQLVDRAPVRDGKVELTLPPGGLGRSRVFIAPAEKLDKPTRAQMERLRAYEPVLQGPGGLLDHIQIPGIIIDYWPFCFCWVRGRVARYSDNRAVCNARVHICEVDRIPWLILKLPDLEVLRLRDDLLDIIRNPPIPRPKPKPFPDPDPGPFIPRPRPGPDPAPFSSPLFRFTRDPGSLVGFNPQPEPPGSRVGFNPQPDPPLERVGLNPQPLPPRDRVALNPQPLPPREALQLEQLASLRAASAIPLSAELTAGLRSTSAVVVRNVLAQNWKLLIPWLCLWPWWWWRFRCDEVAVLTTDAYGRFETTIFYPCGGDRPDLYFWVEYDFGSGFEVVYRPWIACNTYWDYVCGTDVTIRVSDPRVPGCEEEPDLPGCQVVVLSIGVSIAVRQVQTTGLTEGQTTLGQPFGATLEPRVDFSRTELIDNKGIPYYRWSYRRLTDPDGGGGPVDPGSPSIGSWSIMMRDVFRHYKVGTAYPPYFIGPLPTVGPDAAPIPNLFRIRPLAPPAGPEWVVLNEHIDLATAYFDTAQLPRAPTGPEPMPDDLAAGRYEMKLELFDSAGALVNWTASGVDLRITDQDAPFGTGTITTSPAPTYNRILSGSDTMGFRMVVRVDNNRCLAEILPVGGTVTPDPICGFHNYNSPSDVATLSFIARHPRNFATYSFVTTRGPGPSVAAGSTSGVSGEAGTNGFAEISDFTYAKDVIISSLLGPCSNAAFSERLDVHATAIDGYTRRSDYDRADNAAFALALPCPECECEEEGGQGQGQGQGRGRGRGGG
jgi:hypothetical protein